MKTALVLGYVSVGLLMAVPLVRAYERAAEADADVEPGMLGVGVAAVVAGWPLVLVFAACQAVAEAWRERPFR